LTDLAELVTDLTQFEPTLVHEVAARMPVHGGPFTLMGRSSVTNISARHQALGTFVVSAHLLLHRLHAGTGTHPRAIADLYAADRADEARSRPPLLGLLLLAPSPVLARVWAQTPPAVTVVEDALDRWHAPSLIEVGTALALVADTSDDDSDD
jgi:hypothetical protein